MPYTASYEQALEAVPALRGVILSGSPASVYDTGAPRLPAWVLESGLPVLGICYGMQLITQALGGQVAGSEHREYGQAELHVTQAGGLFADLAPDQTVWMSHGDRIERPPQELRRHRVQRQAPTPRSGTRRAR